MIEMDPALNAIISKSIDAAYEEVAAYNKMPMDFAHLLDQCVDMTSVLMLEFDKQGVQGARCDFRRGWNGFKYHKYAVLTIGCEEIIVDGMWQQFLPEAALKDDLPQALIGTREEVMNAAAAAGVEQQYIRLWGPREAYIEPEEMLTLQERIARAIDANPPSPA